MHRTIPQPQRTTTTRVRKTKDRPLSRSWLVVGLAVSLLGCATGADGGSSEASLAFEAEQPFLPGLDYDTGWQPQDSPASIRALASAEGATSVRVQGRPDGDALAAVPGSGELSIEGGIELELSARIDASGVSYEGVVESFRYEIERQSVDFDSFMLGDAVGLTVDLPAQDLGSVPIPSVPGGSLALEVTGGVLDTEFAGTCADVSDGNAQVTGVLTTSGTVQCAASIVIDIPIVGEETFGPFAFDIEIPATDTDMDLGARALSTGVVVEDGSVCDDAGQSKSDAASDDGGTPGDAPEPDDGGSSSGPDMPPADDPPDGDACLAPETCEACVSCARISGGTCSYADAVCELNDQCKQLQQCQNDCAGLPTQQAQWCSIDCFEAHPDGVDDYLSFASCLGNVCEPQCRWS